MFYPNQQSTVTLEEVILYIKDIDLHFVSISPPVVVPLVISCGPTKPSSLEFLKKSIEELQSLKHEGLAYKNKKFKVNERNC